MNEISENYEIQVSPNEAGQRLDKLLSGALASQSLSRSRLQKLIDDGHVTDMAAPARRLTAKTAVKAGDVYRVAVPEAEAADPIAEPIPLDIVYEDTALLVVNKPPGMVVHPAPGSMSGTLVNALLAHCGDSLSGIGGVKRPGIVHRIDKDTSGLLVIAKSDRAHHGLAAQFADHSIARKYDALCWGVPMPPSGSIEGAIGRHPVDRKRMALRDDGKWAKTHYETRDCYYVGDKAVAAHICCQLETGRTHQVRVHMTHIGHPLIGDPVYGRARQLPTAGRRDLQPLNTALKVFRRQALHARSLGFDHPLTGDRLHFERECPSDMDALIQALKC